MQNNIENKSEGSQGSAMEQSGPTIEDVKSHGSSGGDSDPRQASAEVARDIV